MNACFSNLLHHKMLIREFVLTEYLRMQKNYSWFSTIIIALYIFLKHFLLEVMHTEITDEIMWDLLENHPMWDKVGRRDELRVDNDCHSWPWVHWVYDTFFSAFVYI